MGTRTIKIADAEAVLDIDACTSDLDGGLRKSKFIRGGKSIDIEGLDGFLQILSLYQVAIDEPFVEFLIFLVETKNLEEVKKRIGQHSSIYLLHLLDIAECGPLHPDAENAEKLIGMALEVMIEEGKTYGEIQKFYLLHLGYASLIEKAFKNLSKPLQEKAKFEPPKTATNGSTLNIPAVTQSPSTSQQNQK